MSARALLVAAGLLAASIGPALCENVTATVLNWDQANRTITLEDFSKFSDIPATVAVPPTLKAGDLVSIDYRASENGVDGIDAITIINDVAKRLLPPNRG
jgi:hypothetical protein